jgi:hypothetical protein
MSGDEIYSEESLFSKDSIDHSEPSIQLRKISGLSHDLTVVASSSGQLMDILHAIRASSSLSVQELI